MKTNSLTIILIQALLTQALFNLNKRHLSCFPGPRLWACSRAPYALSIQNGTLPKKIKALHDIYGPVVRVAPNELSFNTPEAWKDIYSDKPYGLGRSEEFYRILGPNSIFGASRKDHGRIRGAVSLAFRASALRGYEEKIRQYVDLLVEQLGGLTKDKACDGTSDRVHQDEVTVDIVRWLDFIAFDIIGNLIYGGEPFGCLRRKEFHSWVELIFSWLEATAIFFSIQFYLPLDRLLILLVPTDLIKKKDEFEQLGRDRVLKRKLNADDEADGEGIEDNKGYHRASSSNVLSHLKSSKGERIMTLAELEVTLHHLVIAGSETISTMLSGTINYLCQNPTMLKTLADEVRRAAPLKADLTMANLSQLPYLTAVLKEGLRIVSPVQLSFPRTVPPEGAFINGYWVPGRVSLIHLFASPSASHPQDNQNAQIQLNPCYLPSLPST